MYLPGGGQIAPWRASIGLEVNICLASGTPFFAGVPISSGGEGLRQLGDSIPPPTSSVASVGTEPVTAGSSQSMGSREAPVERQFRGERPLLIAVRNLLLPI